MSVFDAIKRKILKIFNIQPAVEQTFSVTEEMTQATNVLKNRILYRGNAVELSQFFGQLSGIVSGGRFWAGVANKKIRKIHLSYIGTVIDRYTDIVCADLNSISVDEDGQELWEFISKDNKFNKLIEKAVKETLVTGDGAFKLSFDSTISNRPIIDFIPADNVDYKYKRGRLTEIIFFTDIFAYKKAYRLAEVYGYGYIKYELYDANGNKVELDLLEETAELKDVYFDNSIMLAVQFKIFDSAMYKNRGMALFDNKVEEADAIDEVASQWLDAVRNGRVKKYIPEILIPRNKETGELSTMGFEYDDEFVTINSQDSESIAEQIQVIQPDINYDAYVNSYANFLDMLLQGVISPSTLGIDLKKTDNAESQREKEKITCHVRGKIVAALTDVITELIGVALNTVNVINGKPIREYNVSVSFGEYASSDFDHVVAVVGDAHIKGIMSIEMCVNELYGDTLTDAEKAAEVSRLKQEQGIIDTDDDLSVKAGDELLDE
jgi:hypothetical protein